MRAEKLVLKNFRNFDDLELSFRPGLTVITGQNGAGKTNILEALYMCSIGRSPRTRQDGLLIKKGKSASQISLNYVRAGVTRDVGVHLSTTKGKTVVLDGMPSARVGDIVGNFACVYFSPDEINIVRGGPQYRRRYMDIINSHMRSRYMSDLRNLQHCVKQRNAILRGIKMGSGYDAALTPWDSQIIHFSTSIMIRRNNFVRALQRVVDRVMRILTDDMETVRITYRTFCDRLDMINVRTLGKEYYRKVHLNYIKDVLTHTSSVGPHLDDLEIRLVYLHKDGSFGRDNEKLEYINLRNEGSLGQQRTVTLALKIAEIYFYQKCYGERPMLLLDDVLSELDYGRRRRLMRYCSHFDTVVTCTEWSSENPVPDTIYEVEDETVVENKFEKQCSYHDDIEARALELAKDIQRCGVDYFKRDIWVRPPRNAVLGPDAPLEKADRRYRFQDDDIIKILDEQLEIETLQSDDFDLWTDEGKPLKRSHRWLNSKNIK